MTSRTCNPAMVSIVSEVIDDTVDLGDDLVEALIKVLRLQLLLQDALVQFVQHEDRVDPLLKGLAKDNLRLNAHSWNKVFGKFWSEVIETW